MAFGLDEVNYALFQLYPGKKPHNLASWKNIFFSHTRKDGGWTGIQTWPQSVEIVNPQGIGGDFVKAQTASVTASTIGKQFQVPAREKHGFPRISGRAILATDNDEGAFFRAVKKETDNGFRAYQSRLSVEVVNGDGNGWIGRVKGIAGNVVTLGDNGGATKWWFATRFKPGMSLNRSTDGTLANIQVETYTVLKVNPKAGTIELNNVTNLANNNYLAAAGDFETGGAHGALTWIPLTEPGGSDSFFGVNRSIYPTLLAGHRLPTSTASNAIKEQCFDLTAEMSREGEIEDGGSLDAYLHPVQWNRLQKELDAQVKRDQGKDGKFGFPYISYMFSGKEVKFFHENDFPPDVLLICPRQAFYIKHGGAGYPHMNDDDGRPAQRAHNADAIEVRVRSVGNLVCEAPGACGIAPLTVPA
jgi:hypothetical protein